MSTVLRFTYNGTNTDFEFDEVAQLDLDFVQGIDLYRDLLGQHQLYKKEALYHRLRFQFRLAYGNESTISKLETLLGYIDTYKQPAIMTCYYECSISTTNSYQVQMKRDEFVRPFVVGLDASKIVPITFIEAVPDTGDGATVLNPVGS